MILTTGQIMEKFNDAAKQAADAFGAGNTEVLGKSIGVMKDMAFAVESLKAEGLSFSEKADQSIVIPEGVGKTLSEESDLGKLMKSVYEAAEVTKDDFSHAMSNLTNAIVEAFKQDPPMDEEEKPEDEKPEEEEMKEDTPPPAKPPQEEEKDETPPPPAQDDQRSDAGQWGMDLAEEVRQDEEAKMAQQKAQEHQSLLQKAEKASKKPFDWNKVKKGIYLPD